MRHTRGHTRNRRSHHALKSTGAILCVDCGQPKLKHIACASCGKYKGRDVLAKPEKAEKKVSAPKAKKVVKAKKK
jgi:large subunit ribosomal protein L32